MSVFPNPNHKLFILLGGVKYKCQVSYLSKIRVVGLRHEPISGCVSHCRLQGPSVTAQVTIFQTAVNNLLWTKFFNHLNRFSVKKLYFEIYFLYSDKQAHRYSNDKESSFIIQVQEMTFKDKKEVTLSPWPQVDNTAIWNLEILIINLAQRTYQLDFSLKSAVSLVLG